MKLSIEIKYILQGGSPTDITMPDGRFTPNFLAFLADNEIAY